MNKIDLIIFSKNRGCQLDLLLRSLNAFADGVFNITVIYKATNSDFKKAYAKLIYWWPDIYWHLESASAGDSFQGMTREFFAGSKAEHIGLATDDTVIHSVLDQEILKKALPTAENVVFSCRLGYNTIVQDIHRGTVQSPLNVYTERDGYLAWPIAAYHPHENYGYPFGLDLHIYRASLLKRLVEEIDFNNTSQLESQLTSKYRHLIDELRSFKTSVAVNIPVNSVGGMTRAGEFNPATLEELNQKYLDGYLISLDDIQKTKWVGCHAEHNLKFIKET